jgi:glycosyltransferase involved in cell wall biosynthesis
MSKKLISIVCPCYNEQDNLIKFKEKIENIFSNELNTYEYEIFFVDDCSTDNSKSILRDFAKKDTRVKIIFNAINYGPLKSSFNVLKYCKGDAIVPMLPFDMQDPPEVLVEFVKKWENKIDIVYGVKKKRQEGWLICKIRNLYYLIVSKISNVNIPPYVGEFQLIDKKINNILKNYDDYYPYTRGLISTLSSNSASVEYTWKKREGGVSNMRFLKLVDLAINGIISFSNAPIRIFTLLGIIISFISFIFVSVQIFTYFLTDRMTVPGISVLIVSIFFFSGLQFLFFGILGEYIYAIHGQVRRPPKFVIEEEKINID